MRVNHYAPFDDRIDLILGALEAAILWEESRIDAGICEPFVGGDLANTEAEIKAYKKYRRQLSDSARRSR